MVKLAFGEYAAFETPGGIRYQKNKKIVSKTAIPPEVIGYFDKQLSALHPMPTPTVPMPTEEEKKKLREESLKVPAGLEAPERTPEEIAALEANQEAPVEPAPDVVEEPLGVGDFADEYTEPIGSTEPTPTPEEELPEHFKSVQASADFMESVSIHTAPLQDIVEAMYNRFGIYSVYLGTLPAQDEINPLTGETFTKYHLGIAYQAAIRAKSTGLLSQSPEEGRRAIDEGRAASANFAVDAPPQTMAEARRANSFDYRTSPQGNQETVRTEIVHEKGADGKMHAVQRTLEPGEISSVNGAQSKFDAEEEEPLVQPNFSGKPVIRPNW